ncbi:nucleoside diphosphate kinase regulator [Microvirga terricola]|uniref:Nucleoside diphosphate kinase regulator n=1 Tax=Microvirga terricola TaxID=2719797 RepID=A0ABX0VCW0_9HYPH|nr:nucleoside diphosphate kinase regulator [Microvirga terricola]NIX76999.1 nucleoside diphosphate kinase regulator [Microvirga terricola]
MTNVFTKPISNRKPKIVLTEDDYARLSRLADAATERMPEVADYLATELDRAKIVPSSRIPSKLVTMGTTLTFRDEQTGRTERVTLVFPEEANIAEKRISVMTPIGAALIGLSEGQSISWPTRTGEIHRLEVLSVEEAR